jgi:hypothetical protein
MYEDVQRSCTRVQRDSLYTRAGALNTRAGALNTRACVVEETHVWWPIHLSSKTYSFLNMQTKGIFILCRLVELKMRRQYQSDGSLTQLLLLTEIGMSSFLVFMSYDSSFEMVKR